MMQAKTKSWLPGKMKRQGFRFQSNQYGDGDPKLQIGPRAYTRKDGKKSSTKAGRLTVDDVLWLSETLEEVADKMKEFFPRRGVAQATDASAEGLPHPVGRFWRQYFSVTAIVGPSTITRHRRWVPE